MASINRKARQRLTGLLTATLLSHRFIPVCPVLPESLAPVPSDHRRLCRIYAGQPLCRAPEFDF
jgi:hypothetical protein